MIETHPDDEFCVPVHRLADVSTTIHQHEIANELCMPNGSANIRLESGDSRCPFESVQCQFCDGRSPVAV